MKSILLSILMFIVIFTALKFNILSLIDNHIIFYVAIIGIIVVIISALYFVGVPKLSDFKKPTLKKEEEKDD